MLCVIERIPEKMARLNVSDVLKDPDFSSYIFVKRSKNKINNLGRVEQKQQSIKIPATIYPTGFPVGGTTLQRLPEGERTEGLQSVFCLTHLIVNFGDMTADIVIINGREYTVIRQMDWDFGESYTELVCKLNAYRNEKANVR